MKRAVLLAISDAMLASDEGRYFPYDSLKSDTIDLENYKARLPYEWDDGSDGYAHRLCDLIWRTFQNVDEDRMPPDGGRSMMVGDVVEIDTDYGHETTKDNYDVEYWMCDRSGWKRVTLA